MITQAEIDRFCRAQSLALVGASRRPKAFGNLLLKGLRENGIRVFPVHPEADEIEGLPCVPSLAALPQAVDGLVIALPRHKVLPVVQAAVAAGISRVWLQQGSESPEALAYAKAQGLPLIHGHCLLMFLPQGAAIHRWHHTLWQWFGKVPA